MEILANTKYYTKEHEWIYKDLNDIFYIGITEFAQNELGDIVYLDIEDTKGNILSEGQVFGTVEAVKTVSDLFMPISGEILDINQEIAIDPSLINSSKGDSWIITVKGTDIQNANLLTEIEYFKLIGWNQ